MNDWMRALADHYAESRRRHPLDDLMIVFDVDGTILDMRHMVRHVLREYDRTRGTDHFHGLCAEDVDVHENRIEGLLERFELTNRERSDVFRWYLEQRWTSDAILAAHRPYPGVMEVIRWFQLQPRTFVGINTGRPEIIRRDTLDSLNALGSEHRVVFEDELLHMNPGTWEEGVQDVKAHGLVHFRELGFRVVAALDNEPSNLASMARADPEGEVIFLHAETLFESSPCELPRMVAGSSYDVGCLVRASSTRRRRVLRV